MPNKVQYEHGARKPTPLTGPDPNDEISQEAAKNRKPPLGIGLTEKVDETEEKTRHSDNKEVATGKRSEHPPRDTREIPASNPEEGSAAAGTLPGR